ncbi:hypothetical protein [Emticicia soli]|uniref:Uncharacterized protein n=1 Tax=Emticicia soli TaxID=2027878 RepID=A0ABW5JAW6_9BACT
MNSIKEILKKENLSFDDLINCFEMVKESGQIALIKFDGARLKDYYTVLILNAKNTIRLEGSDLKKGLIEVLIRYADGNWLNFM